MNIQTKFHHRLFQKLSVAALGTLALIMTGCGPEEWLVWAPDGGHAIVRDGSRLIDAAGNTLGNVAGEKESVAAWLPDSHHVLVVRGVDAQSWEEYAGLLGEARVTIVSQSGAELARVLAEYHGALEEFDSSFEFVNWKENLDARGESLETVLQFLNVSRPGLLDPLLKAYAKKDATAAQAQGGIADPGKPEPTAADIREEIGVPQIHELHVRSTLVPADSDDQLLLRCPDAFGPIAVSPSGRAVAFVRREGADLRLYVMALEAGAQPVLVENDAEFAAWSPDGQDLAYTKSDMPRRAAKSGLGLGAIARRRVCTPEGMPIAEPDAGEDIAGLILPEFPARVAWLPDGRILFAGAKFTLPATTQNLPNGLTLFALRPLPTPTVEQLLPDSVPARLTERVNYFTVSPDGKKVAILGKSGAVSVLTLESKSLATFQDVVPQFEKNGRDDSLLVPAWRTADELTYLVPAGDPAGSPRRAEVVIASLRGGKRAISKSWPDSATLPTLEK